MRFKQTTNMTTLFHICLTMSIWQKVICVCTPCESRHATINLSSTRKEGRKGWLLMYFVGYGVKSTTMVKTGLNQQCPLIYIWLVSLPHNQQAMHSGLNALQKEPSFIQKNSGLSSRNHQLLPKTTKYIKIAG
jgi:hypothetical protein